MAETTGLSKELADLKGLLDADLIDASEYVAKKEGILGRVKTMGEARSLSSSGLIDEEEQAKAYEQARNCTYAEAESLYQKSTIESVREAQGKFKSLGDWKDAPTRVRRCNERIANLTAEADAKKEKIKKLIKIGAIVAAVIIAIILVVTQVVMPAQRRAAFEKVGLPADIAVGKTTTLGQYEQDNNASNGKEKITWKVLAVESDKVLLISEKALDCKQFNSSGSKGNDWDKSDLKAWLQGDFAKSADLSEYASGLTCLSIDEAEKYFPSDKDRMCVPTAYAVAQGAWQSEYDKIDGAGACDWWLRSAGSFGSRAADVYTDGYVDSDGWNVGNSSHAVRPALWINL